MQCTRYVFTELEFLESCIAMSRRNVCSSSSQTSTRVATGDRFWTRGIAARELVVLSTEIIAIARKAMRTTPNTRLFAWFTRLRTALCTLSMRATSAASLPIEMDDQLMTGPFLLSYGSTPGE